MAKQQEYGKYGEELAVQHLMALGYTLLQRNWRYGHLEVDIIARDGDVLLFIEVKSRSTTAFGHPADFVDLQKQRFLLEAADAYLAASLFDGEIRFDIVSVYLDSKLIEHIKDAFWSDF
ncbi:YraN family protein [Sphingobacterium sp. Mn56C]|uniref:YraN family protein n=1 Tax=Sphingobacterium sp. Mn56C TaxID=3395261 RepID=UPI003BBC7B64